MRIGSFDDGRRMKKIAITNMTGGLNRGCEALVSSILHGLGTLSERQSLSVKLHTQDEPYDSFFFRDRIDTAIPISPLPLARWSTGQQRLFFRGVATLGRLNLRLPSLLRGPADLAASDLIIATGGDVFTGDYGSFPRHSRVLQAGPPVAMMAQTIGPFGREEMKRFKDSLGNIVLCTVRESETLEYLKAEIPELKAEQTADVAFMLPITPAEEARRLLEVEHRFPVDGRRMVGISISSGILSYRKDVESDLYLKEIAAFIDALNADGISAVIIPHVQERAARNNDIYACREVLRRCRTPQQNVILSMPLSASDFKGIIGLCEALVGARTHATIASMSQGIPTVSIAYSRKAWGIMRDYYGAELGAKLTIDVARLDRDQMLAALSAARANGHTPEIATEMRRRAGMNFERIGTLLATR